MHIAAAFALFALGLYLIIKGGDLFVDAASWIAAKSGIPPFVIGATVVSIATTLPELMVSVLAAGKARAFSELGDYAAAAGQTGITISNAVGSATANIGLILAISLFCAPSCIPGREFRMKAIMLLTASVALCAFGLSGQIGLWQSVLLLILFALFIIESVTAARHGGQAPELCEESDRPRAFDPVEWAVRALSRNNETARYTLKFILGAAGIAFGANMLVENGTLLAHAFGVSESIIGVTMIAIGTSLPELITTITAVRKRKASMSVGNIVGANVIDLTVILPLSALVSGAALEVPRQSRLMDLPVCALLCAVALVPPLIKGIKTGDYRFTRAQGGLLIGLYSAYILIVVAVL